MISESTLHEYLRAMPIINLAYVADGHPATSVLLTCVDESFGVSFATRTNSFKALHLVDGKEVSWTAWQIGKFYLQAEGVISVISSEKEENEMLEKIINCSHGLEAFWPPILHTSLDAQTTVYHIKPSRMRVLDLSVQTLTRAHGEAWQDIV